MALAVLHLDVHAGFSAGGFLAKTWSADVQWLYKGASSEDTMIRICSEYICSQLAAALGIRHVVYDWVHNGYQINDSSEVLDLGLVRCRNFIPAGSHFISFYEIFRQQQDSLENTLAEFAKAYLVDFCRMLLFDYLVANTDRHHKNFGVLVHSDGTKEMAPIFDHDWALFPEWCEGSFVFEQPVGTVREKTFLQTLNDLPGHVSELHNNPLELLDWHGFLARKDKIIAACPRLSLKRKISIANMLEIRAKHLLQILGG